MEKTIYWVEVDLLDPPLSLKSARVKVNQKYLVKIKGALLPYGKQRIRKSCLNVKVFEDPVEAWTGYISQLIGVINSRASAIQTDVSWMNYARAARDICYVKAAGP